MLDEEFTSYLSSLKSDLNFKGLINHLNDSDIVFKNNRLRNACGMTTFECIYIDIEALKWGFSDELVFFIFLHEMGHYKRIIKYGKNFFIGHLSNNNKTSLFEYLMLEEDIADRYASHLYNKLNGKNIPTYISDILNSSNRKQSYCLAASDLVGRVNNDENNYKKIMESYIL